MKICAISIKLLLGDMDFVYCVFKFFNFLHVIDLACTCGRFQNFFCIGSSPMSDILYGLMESSSLLWILIKFLKGTAIFLFALSLQVLLNFWGGMTKRRGLLNTSHYEIFSFTDEIASLVCHDTAIHLCVIIRMLIAQVLLLYMITWLPVLYSFNFH